MLRSPKVAPSTTQTNLTSLLPEKCGQLSKESRTRSKLDHDPPVVDWHYGFKENYNVVNGELRFGSIAKLYVLDVVQQRVIFEHHGVPLAGHPGAEETHRSYKRRPNQPNAPLRPRQPQRVFETIACDIMGPYPETLREDDVFVRFGYPQTIITDNGKQFNCRRWVRACQRWRVRRWTTATYAPRQNPTERRNQEVKKALRLHLHDQPDHEWDCSIPNVLFAIRRRSNAATGASPSKILYGQNLPYSGSWDAPATIAPLVSKQQIRADARSHQARYVEERRPVPAVKQPPQYQSGSMVLIQSRSQSGVPF
ncbi:uncharacterized protein [Tenebrio molitor]|uniref:uncharacterized protein n=1 Tax=Tenebrio molitor TaxID=7067 RepID=UPI0036249F4E